VLVAGASGNIGTALLRRLAVQPEIEGITGIARRVPGDDAGPPYDQADWHGIDLAEAGVADRLAELMRGADSIVHLAWQIVAGHDRPAQARTNLIGSEQVLAAALWSGVPQLVHLSSAAAYSGHPGADRVTETAPRRGIPSSAYSRDKVAVEDRLDIAEAEHPQLRVVRIRPPAVLSRPAASEIARMLMGRLAGAGRLARGRVPLLPLPPRTVTQVVAAEDVADLITRAIVARAAGPFNVADEPVLTSVGIARLLGGLHLPVPAPAMRAVLDLTWRLRLQPLDGSWLDLLVNCPLLDTTRARTELHWRPQHDARATIADVRRGIAEGAGAVSPALRPLSRSRRQHSARASDGEGQQTGRDRARRRT
jgi:UDP-glucose 4-epimerase